VDLIDEILKNKLMIEKGIRKVTLRWTTFRL